MPDLQAFADNVSIVEGHRPRHGYSISTRMIIVKLADGPPWLNSPVSVSPDILERIKASGPVTYLIAPTRMQAVSQCPVQTRWRLMSIRWRWL